MTSWWIIRHHHCTMTPSPFNSQRWRHRFAHSTDDHCLQQQNTDVTSYEDDVIIMRGCRDDSLIRIWRKTRSFHSLSPMMRRMLRRSWDLPISLRMQSMKIRSLLSSSCPGVMNKYLFILFATKFIIRSTKMCEKKNKKQKNGSEEKQMKIG